MEQHVENKRESKITEQALSMFYGSEGLHRYMKGTPYFATDGARFLMDNGAAWLIDVVFSYQQQPRFKEEGFQVWTLDVKDGKGKVTADDGNGVELVTQEIEYTDFPLPTIKLYCVGDEERVVMLPSEY